MNILAVLNDQWFAFPLDRSCRLSLNSTFLFELMDNFGYLFLFKWLFHLNC